MNKWIFAVGLAVIGSASIYAFLKEPYVEPAPVIQEEVLTERLMTIENILPLERTVFFVGLEGIPQLWIHLTKHLETGISEAMPRALDAELWKQRQASIQETLANGQTWDLMPTRTLFRAHSSD